MERLLANLTLKEATNAIKSYNLGYHGKKLNIAVIDQEGYQLFKS